MSVLLICPVLVVILLVGLAMMSPSFCIMGIKKESIYSVYIDFFLFLLFILANKLTILLVK